MQNTDGEFFQLGYVTRDLDRAVDLYAERYGVPEFYIFDTYSSPARPPGMPPMRVGLAWKGPVMLEFIQPEDAPDSIYQHCLRDDGGLMLHHVGYRVDYEQLKPLADRFRANGVPVPVQTDNPGAISIFYADTRKDNGLFAEYVVIGPKSTHISSAPRF